ncbi:MAG: M3 family oligoendopeptidase [Clostridiales bacterium]|nr:M3 family oligoendopeptidase [Clostridiales bacterium]
MKFKDMIYRRPDVEKLTEDLSQLTERFKKATDFESAEKIFSEVDELYRHYSTMATLAYIRHEIDTRDEFYDSEKKFLDENDPIVEEYMHKWALTLLETPFRPKFEEKYGKLLFLNTEIGTRAFSAEIVSELQEENALVTEYTKLLASACISFEGGEYTLSQLAPYKQDVSDDRRLAAWNADAGFFSENGKELDRIYDRLVKLRDSMAKKLGYENFIELGYYRMTRNSYNREDVDKFRAAVRKHLVPVADSIYRRQAERLGKDYPMNFADNALEFRSGNPRPHGDPEEILNHGRLFYHELSPETAEFIDFMYENELLDVLSRVGKAGGGFCTMIADYKAPFIFANFNGTAHDVEVITHEAGHAFAAYMAKDIIPSDLQNPTYEACEVHSMSMEFFAWPWAEGFFGKDTAKFKYTHLSGALTFIPYGTMVDHFQHLVYENPHITPEERHEIWRQLLGIYMPWVRMGEIPFYGEGKGWQRQGHIYQTPFYYIDYCLAQTVALQFWALMMDDREAAWKAYMDYTRPGGTKTFTELISAAGLALPFDDDALETVCKRAAQWLDDFDLGDIE